MKSQQLIALKSAERFVQAEIAVREKSYLPDPTEAERRDLSDAVETKQIIQRAIVDGELEPDLYVEMLGVLKSVLAHVEDENAVRVGAQCTLCFSYRKMIRDVVTRASYK